MRFLLLCLARLCEPLIDLRQQLVSHYFIVESRGFKITKEVCDKLYNFFASIIGKIHCLLQERNVIVSYSPQEKLLEAGLSKGYIM
jgi:hypothetical protein